MTAEVNPHVTVETRPIEAVVAAMGEVFQDSNPTHENLELINRVWNGDHRTMYERTLSDLAPLAVTAQLQRSTPKPVYDRKERIIWMRDEFTKLHTEGLQIDADRVNAFITGNPNLLLLDNGSGYVFSRLTHADIKEGETVREPSSLALYRGKNVIAEKGERCKLVCDFRLVARLIAAEQEQA